MDLLEDAEHAELTALIAAGEEHESFILDFAQKSIVEAESSIASALEGGFRAKVPLAGGSIASAIGAAVATLESQQAVSLKGAYDLTIAKLKAAATAKAP